MRLEGDKYLALAAILAISLWTVWYGVSTGSIIITTASSLIAASATISTLYIEGVLKKRRRLKVRVHRRS